MSQTLAYIHPDAKIGSNVEIEPFTTIHGDVEIGEGTWIGSNVTIMDGARIGKNCRIFPGAVISAIPQDLKFAGEKTTVEIGDNSTIRECVTINRGTVDRMTTKIGNNVLLMAYVHIAHDCVIGNNSILANSVQMGGHAVVGDFAIIGGTSAIHQFVHIGEHSILAGGSLLNKDVPPYIKGAKYPVSYHGVNIVGLRRRGFSNDQIENIRDIYRTLFQSGKNTSAALQHIQSAYVDSPYKDQIIDFVQQSKMGIIKGYS